jgi:glycosyltransferase involved in cell wall biosynthesis
MDLTVTLEARYFVTPDGTGWTASGTAQKFWRRYLEVFDHVRIVARAVPVERALPAWLPVTGDGVSLIPMPNYLGPWSYLRRSRAFQRAIRAARPKQGAVILRVPSHLGGCLERYLRERKHPYALEVVGDPQEVFAPGVVDHPLRPFFRWHFSRQLRRQCREANGVAYVTERVLQMRYPAKSMVGISDAQIDERALAEGGLWSHYSSIDLESEAIGNARGGPNQKTYRLVAVGSLAQRYKGIDVLIGAVARCVEAGLNLTAVVVGDGRFRSELEARAKRLGVAARISFIGEVPAGKPVRDILDASDLFVMPSRTEGLPRAMIEAMARGLPCIGSAVGGIPELLDAGNMVMPDDPDALAAKIREVLGDHVRMSEMSQRNLATAKKYAEPVLAARRRLFYEQVRDFTEAWERRSLARRCKLPDHEVRLSNGRRSA